MCVLLQHRPVDCLLTMTNYIRTTSITSRLTNAATGNIFNVVYVVVMVVNSFISRSLNHRQFQALVDEVGVQYGDLLYFCEVRWLNQGSMLPLVCDLQKEIATFLPHNNLPYADQLFDPRWLARLTLLTDIITHLNALNVKMQSKYIIVTYMHAHITAFGVKVRLWEAQLATGQLEHFPRLATCVPDDVEPNTCVSVVASLMEEFASRFAGIRPGCGLQAVYHPFDFPVDDAPPYPQMELVELQCNDELKAKFYNSSPLSFFGDIALSLLGIFLNILRMFNASQPCLAAPRPYCCEQHFPKIK